MNRIVHERPGVYSAYDVSSVTSAGRAARIVGVAARAAKGTVGVPVTVTGYAAGVEVFGEDAGTGMSAILRLLFANGASAVTAVRVADAPEEGEDSAGRILEDYQAAFAVLGRENVQVVLCDSGDLAVQQALRSAVEEASAGRREWIAIAGGDGEDVSGLIERAKALNSERMVLTGPDALDTAGNVIPGVLAAAALAGAAAAERDPAVPINGVELKGLGGLAQDYGDNDIDLLVRGGVTPLECVGGVVSPVRGVTTRTSAGGAGDAAWRELTTILIVDDVIPAIRDALRAKFSRTKNTARNRGAIRSQVVVELEKKLAAEIIDGYGDVSVSASPDDPAVCLVEFSFTVAHGLNQIYLTAHITV